LIVGFIILAALYLLSGTVNWPIDRQYSTVMGSVVETKIVVDRIQDSIYGGKIYYRIDAHVIYKLGDLQQDRWLTASDSSTARELLNAKLASHPKSCLVYWPPSNPGNAKCKLE
jgi:hypothetical protein